jgi:orotidine-5'-phosphate decarboxylase
MKKHKLIVALDVPTLAQAQKLVETLKDTVEYFKVGKELFTSEGPAVVKMVHDHGAKVFLDLKFHDIPNTVAGAVRSAAKLGVWMVNVHASGGAAMMAEAAQAAAASAKPPLVIGVTVLTSMNEEGLKEIGVAGSAVGEQVVRLARLAKTSGLSGVVASAQEATMLRRAFGKDFLIVTPGVRPAGAAVGDQKRVLTPKDAIAAGADCLVVGRPITESADPKAAAEAILKEMKG